MTMFTISVHNETFNSTLNHDGPTPAQAIAHGLKSALEIGVEEVAAGKQLFAAVVNVGTANETFSRFVVSIGTSPLLITN